MKKNKSKQHKPQLYVALYDIHYPVTHWPTFNAVLDFLRQNKVDGIVLGGDQRDNQEISPHTKGKPRLREAAGRYMANLRGFDKNILKPIEALLPKNAERIYILGNHCHWEEQFIDEHPEWDGVQTHVELNVAGRGWKVIECGKHFRKGKLTFIHGEQLAGIGNQVPGAPAKKAVEAYNSNVLFGHFHAPQSFSKIMPFDQSQKLMAWCSPIVGATNPLYLRNKPTSWVNGFCIVEFQDNGTFNVYPIVVTNGTFSYGGKTYGK